MNKTALHMNKTALKHRLSRGTNRISADRRLSSSRNFNNQVFKKHRSLYMYKLQVLAPMLCYLAAYLLSFALIERWNRLHYTVIHTAVDDMIPFVPAFVIPYLLWFPYVVCFTLFLLMFSEKSYHRLCTVLAIGMTVFIAVSVVFPNIHLMRPGTMPSDTVFTRLISLLYMVDTPTNLTPSIHVYNSLAITGAAWQWDWRTDSGDCFSDRARRFWRGLITALGLLIILSTMMIKQHSFSDVVIAVSLFMFTYVLVYRFDFTFIEARHRRRPVLQLDDSTRAA